MRRALLALFWTGLAATAQFSDPAVTDDGAQVYFASTLPLRGETGSGIFRWNSGQLERFALPPDADPLFPRFVTFRGRPVVSGGGTVVSWTDSRVCQGGSSCLFNPTTSTSNLSVPGMPPVTLPGRVQISRNGRYVVNFQELRGMGVPPQNTREFRDLTTATVTQFDFSLSSDTQSLTSDGRLLGFEQTSLVLWSTSGTRRIGEEFASAVISDNAQVVVAVSGPAPGLSQPRLTAIDIESGTQVALGTGTDPSISNDGLRVVFRSGSPSQLYLASTVTGERRQLTDLAEGVTSGVLAGFGHVAFATTRDGRILRIDTDTYTTTDLIPRTPTIFLRSSTTPCAAVRIEGYNLIGSDPVTITLDGLAVPVSTTEPAAVWAQIPCDVTPSPTPRTLQIANNSPFANSFEVTVRRAAPWVIPAANEFAPTVHQDFSGPVTPDNPAQPGEVVHLWGTGFGAVDRTMATGEAAPFSPLVRLVDPVACAHSVDNTPVEIAYAGLAPGLTGIFQLDLRIPMNAEGLLPVRCDFVESTNITFYTDVARRNN